MKEIEYKPTNDPSDLSDVQWAKIASYFPMGNKGETHKRSLVEAVLYLVDNIYLHIKEKIKMEENRNASQLTPEDARRAHERRLNWIVSSPEMFDDPAKAESSIGTLSRSLLLDFSAYSVSPKGALRGLTKNPGDMRGGSLTAKLRHARLQN